MKIRKQIFETNSSSSHSITICNDIKNYVLDYIDPDDDGSITLTGGEYGWQWDYFNDAREKANYCAQTFHNHEAELQLLTEVLIEQTGADQIIFDLYGYVDHDSDGVAFEAAINKETLKNFIFNKNSYLYLGNDNDEAPPGWGSN